jgi:hypothetical protein
MKPHCSAAIRAFRRAGQHCMGTSEQMGLARKLVSLASLVILVLLGGAWQKPAGAGKPSLPTAKEIDSVLKELAAITGFRIRRQLPFALVTREEINVFLKDQIKKSVKPDEVRAEEITLKKFGFVPPDFDLKKTTIELLTEQAAAYYDFRRKKLFISDWATTNMRDAALIHELAHALADQNFPIRKFLNKGSENSEISTAREAVVEGQASWLMQEVDARRQGKTLANPQTARELLNIDMDSDDAAYPVFNQVPLYLKKTLLFPYAEGENFQEAVVLHDGKGAFERVFRQPPVSTSQIQHPERYFAGETPTSPKLPAPAADAKPFVTGSLGELETRILLQQYVNSSTAAALGPQLRGAGYRVDELKKDNRTMLVFASEWDNDDSASRFFEAYQQVLRGKWKSMEVSGQTALAFEGKSEDGYFKVVREGTRILSREGFANPPA